MPTTYNRFSKLKYKLWIPKENNPRNKKATTFINEEVDLSCVESKYTLTVAFFSRDYILLFSVKGYVLIVDFIKLFYKIKKKKCFIIGTPLF